MIASPETSAESLAAPCVVMVPAHTTTTTTQHQHQHQHHEVEGRNRSALSYNLLKQHIKDYKFERIESYTDVSHADESKGSSKTMDSTTYSDSLDLDFEDLAVTGRIVTTPTSSCAAVRSKFFHKLGIAPKMSERNNSAVVQTTPPRRNNKTEPSYETQLNDMEEECEISSLLKRGLAFFQKQSSSLSSSDSSAQACEPTDKDNNGMQRSVQFHPTVQVHPIPKHSVYSKRIRETVWTSAQEMEENVARNCIEFAAEEWDWNKVLEDQEMIAFHGELVHPVHFAMNEFIDE